MADLEASHATIDHTGLTGVGGGGGGGLSSGSSFPAQPAFGNHVPFYRTDRDLLYFYDGAQWLTVNEYTLTFSMADNFVNNGLTGNGAAQFDSAGRASIPHFFEYDLFLTEFVASLRPDATNDAFNYWNISPRWVDATDSADNYIETADTSSVTAGQYATRRRIINAVLDSGARDLSIATYKTGSPGVLRTLACALTYRLVG